MKIKHLTPETYKTTTWSGGKTTQLYIYPETALYNERHFLFRLSSATVEDEVSTFTTLHNIKRELVVLKGNMKLVHEGKYEKVLMPYEKDCFSGEWKTTSYGKATDFNLMMQKGLCGNLEVIDLEVLNSQRAIEKEAAHWDIEGFYCAEGEAKIQVGDVTYLLKQGELLLFEQGRSLEKKILDKEVICRANLSKESLVDEALKLRITNPKDSSTKLIYIQLIEEE